VKTLLIEDNPGDARLLRAALADAGATGIEIVEVDRAEAGVAKLAGGDVDVVLLDLELPDSHGLEAVVRIHGAAPRVPIVVLTGHGDEALAMQALHEGAQDYLIKGLVNGELLVRALRYASERLRHEERERAFAAERAAREAAEMAVRAREEFLSIASHELRTPLTSLVLHLQLLQARATAGRPPLTPERLIEGLGSARLLADQLARMVDNLLAAAQIGGRRPLLTLEPIELSALVREVTRRFQLEAARSGCSIELRAEVVTGIWDRTRLDQIVTNLISNAIKYGSGQPIEIEVGAEPRLARLVVRDHGIGIAPEDQERVFGEFERVATWRRRGGLGLGLWIVRKAVDALGGRVVLASELGQGATFTVELPRPVEYGRETP
jgi:signal transduction histidine kinase